jgi:hypothetical protein
LTPIRFTPQEADVRRIAELWHATANLRADDARSDETLKWLITNTTVHWYKVGRSLLYISDRQQAISAANLTVFGDSMWLFRNATPFLTKLMVLESLNKLYILSPSPAPFVKRLAKIVGFRHEGALKQGVKYNGKLVSLEIYGLLASEVGNGSFKTKKEGSKRKRPRKGRPRREGSGPPKEGYISGKTSG